MKIAQDMIYGFNTLRHDECERLMKLAKTVDNPTPADIKAAITGTRKIAVAYNTPDFVLSEKAMVMLNKLLAEANDEHDVVDEGNPYPIFHSCKRDNLALIQVCERFAHELNIAFVEIPYDVEWDIVNDGEQELVCEKFRNWYGVKPTIAV